MDTHPQALLLPWYLSGTLSSAEVRQVTSHLASCLSCRGELAALTIDRRRVREAFNAGPAPSPELRDRVLRQIWKSAGGPPEPSARRAGWLLRPHWRVAAALAGCVIAAQLVVILRLAEAPQPASMLTTRGLPAGGTRLRLHLNPRANEAQLAELLRALPGRIVDGPSADGAYVVETPITSPGGLTALLARVRANPNLIRDAELVAP
jgi:hypothetical protein